MRKRAEELKREPTIDESFACTHSRKKDQSLVDEKSKEAYEKYKKRLSEIQSSTQGEGSTSQIIPLPQLSIGIQMNIWKEVVGLTKKSKIYEFGMEGSCASTTSPPTSTKVSIELLEKEKQLKKKLKKRLNRVEKQLDHTTKQLDQTTKQLSETTELVKTLMQQMNFTIPISTNVGVGNGGNGSNSGFHGGNDEEEEEEEEEDDDDGDDDDDNHEHQENEDADENDG
ncbi:hypothetical protein Cgig2_015877 [Carnegiea gigantea]|uniref:Uncharacterized protein n=1 Tax=Carnegiea gigantea TaxID=171969 RepID=A0A9Q1GSV0_9CARY|nr:hypothetical protein Cgig2_015877 [Carnegiea gigantea]